MSARPERRVARRIIAISRGLLIRRRPSRAGERSAIVRFGKRSRSFWAKAPAREARPSHGSDPSSATRRSARSRLSAKPSAGKSGRYAVSGARCWRRRARCSPRRSVGDDVLDTGEFLDLFRVLGGEHLPLAALAPFVAVRQVQDRPARRSIEEEIRVGHFDAAEVVEVVGLAETRVADRRRRPLEDERSRPCRSRHTRRPAPRRELLRRKIRREEREPLLRQSLATPRAE